MFTNRSAQLLNLDCGNLLPRAPSILFKSKSLFQSQTCTSDISDKESLPTNHTISVKSSSFCRNSRVNCCNLSVNEKAQQKSRAWELQFPYLEQFTWNFRSSTTRKQASAHTMPRARWELSWQGTTREGPRDRRARTDPVTWPYFVYL